MTEGPVLVLGASGATGKWVVKQLVDRGHSVRIIVRSADNLPDLLQELDSKRLTITDGSPLDMSDDDFREQLKGAQAVVSCLGHNLNFKGVFGHPRRLVTDATRRVCQFIEANPTSPPVKFLLMNTVGNVNHLAGERVGLAERGVLGLLRLLIPPHVDNEQAAAYLQTTIGPDAPAVEWVVVRPDSLLHADSVSEYELHPSPTRSAIFNSGKTNRINVAYFMVELIDNPDLWNEWKGQMPVIYNRQT